MPDLPSAMPPPPSPPPSAGAGRDGRTMAMRAVFAALMNPATPAAEALNNLPREAEDHSHRSGRARKLARGIVAAFALHRTDIDRALAAESDYAPDELSQAERAVVCAAAAELLARPKTPAPIIINEFVEIAKTHGVEDGFKLVNAMLDRIADRLRERAAR